MKLSHFGTCALTAPWGGVSGWGTYETAISKSGILQQKNQETGLSKTPAQPIGGANEPTTTPAPPCDGPDLAGTNHCNGSNRVREHHASRLQRRNSGTAAHSAPRFGTRRSRAARQPPCATTTCQADHAWNSTTRRSKSRRCAKRTLDPRCQRS